VVLRSLFEGSTRSVLVAGFVVYEGRALFRDLVLRRDAVPTLSVRFFLNVARDHRSAAQSDAEVLEGFAERVRTLQWP
jgi:hypothetical protein